MTEARDDGASVGLGEAAPGRGAHRFSHAAMATVFEVHCVHADARYAAQAAQAAFDLVDRLEQELSRFVENSDISRINHLVPRGDHAGEPVDDGVPADRVATSTT